MIVGAGGVSHSEKGLSGRVFVATAQPGVCCTVEACQLAVSCVCLQRAGKETAFETPTFGLNRLSVYSFCCLGQFGRTFGRSFESTLTARIFSSFCAVVLINNETGDHIVARYRDCGMPGGRPGNST
jgi:hypothetical protein